MTIYAVYTGKDLNSYVCELTYADDQGATLPAYRLQMGGPRKQTGTWQDLHPSTHWGSMTVIIQGRIEFGVTAGEKRTVRGRTRALDQQPRRRRTFPDRQCPFRGFRRRTVGELPEGLQGLARQCPAAGYLRGRRTRDRPPYGAQSHVDVGYPRKEQVTQP
jgi:hypothetical protein